MGWGREVGVDEIERGAKKKVGQNQYLKFLLYLCILRSQKSNIGLNGRFLHHINRLTTLKKLKHFYGLIGVTLAFSFVKEVCMYSKREKKMLLLT